MLNDIKDFFIAVVISWAGLVTGGVTVALITLRERWKGTTIRRGLAVALILVAGIAAVFSTWRDEKTKRVAAEKDLSVVLQEKAAWLESSNKLRDELLIVKSTNAAPRTL